ncbi:Tc toxin subunit A-related protein [Granulibacter bethesdensis]|nr:neuraminidase-like domain-containing protein [Granulibacter bethesdensis]
MLPSVEKELNESRRDALVSAYLHMVAPSGPRASSWDGTLDGLYQYLLIDPGVSDEVQTSRVAQAIASLQQYLTRIANGLEAGRGPMDATTIAAWRSADSQYSVWAAGAEVQNYPENYIASATRLQKSHYFEELENTLNQNCLDPDRVQDAVLAYLNEFEAVSNLYVLSGYIDSVPFSKAVYYFIGRTTSRPYRYYVRRMDLSANQASSQKLPVTPNCWSDWEPVALPLTSDAVIEHTISPVFYNGRLYVAWVERDPTELKGSDNKRTGQHVYSMKFGYARHDGTWSAPHVASLRFSTNGTPEAITERWVINDANIDLKNIRLLAMSAFADGQSKGGRENPSGYLMLGAFLAGDVDAQGSLKTYAYLYCDHMFNDHELSAETRKLLYSRYIDAGADHKCLQFPVYERETAISKIERDPAEEAEFINDSEHTNWVSKIVDPSLEAGGSIIRLENGGRTLKVQMKLGSAFQNIYSFPKSADKTEGKEYLSFRSGEDSCLRLSYGDDDRYAFVETKLIADLAHYEDYDYTSGSWTLWVNPTENDKELDFHLLTTEDNQDILYLKEDGKIVLASLETDPSGFIDLSGKKIQKVEYNSLKNTTSDIMDQLLAKNKLVVTVTRENIRKNILVLDDIAALARARKFRKDVSVALRSGTTACLQIGSEAFKLSEGLSEEITHEISETNIFGSLSDPYVMICLRVRWRYVDRLTKEETEIASDVWKWYRVYLNIPNVTFSEWIPQIRSRKDPKRGLVQYLHFGNDQTLPTPTRLNTTFVHKLVERTSLGLDSLFDYDLQADTTLEGGLDNESSSAMDFHGANGLYFWELFFHLPFLVASRFASEQQFDHARTWLRYLFDPARRATDTVPAYWNVKPLLEDDNGDLSRLVADPLDADAHAYAHPVVYRKAVFHAYVATLISEGDSWYRQLTRDGLTQARLCYAQASDLLGPRPDVTLSSGWSPAPLGELARTNNTALRAYEATLDSSTIPVLRGEDASYLRLADNGAFHAPLNARLLTQWDGLDVRLYNLRHGLTLDGKPLSLPLYDAAADPVALLTQRARSGATAASGGGLQPMVPPYRFSAMLARAYNAVGTLTRFGDGLLSLLERSDRASQEELAQQQLMDMSSYTLALQKQAIDGLAADRTALQASRAVTQQRHEHYLALFQENISSTELFVMDANSAARVILDVVQDLGSASGALRMLPNIFGFSDGGSRYEGATEAVAYGLTISAQQTSLLADRLATTENYRRRQQDWQIQYLQAEAELAALDRQIEALAIRETSARTSLDQAQAQQVQTQTMLTFLHARFTQAALYQWLNGQLAALYYRAYDAVVSTCLAAQACWQYEMGDRTTTFIQSGTWNDHYRGLQVGETLLLNLHQMEAAYLVRNERRLSIVRTLSLKDHLENAFEKQKDDGQFIFEISEDLLDLDYPGHYLRQIKTLTVTLPTLIGPYQNVKATLTQTYSATLLAPHPDGVTFMRTGQGNGNDVMVNWRPSQTVALSSGYNDSGTFELRLDDERYLPFEGTGAVSRWVLTFPRAKPETLDNNKILPADTQQRLLLDNLDDVLVQIHYTACDGGPDFAHNVKVGLAKAPAVPNP